MPTFPPLPDVERYLDNQVALAADLALHGCDALGQVSALNLAAARALTADAIALGRKIVAADDFTQMGTLLVAGWGPLCAHLGRYQQGLGKVLMQASGSARAPASVH